MVWVHEMAAYQIDDQLKGRDRRILGVQNEYDTLPECLFLKDFFDKYKAAFLMEKSRGLQAPSKPLASPLQAKNKNRNRNRNRSRREKSPSPQNQKPSCKQRAGRLGSLTLPRTSTDTRPSRCETRKLTAW